MPADAFPKPRRPGGRAAVLLLLVLAVLALLAAAPPPDPATPEPASLPAATTQDDELEGCSADERRERLAKEAARKDLNTLAIMATTWAVDHAEKIAASHWEAVGVEFLKGARQRGERFLHAIRRRGERARSINAPTCRAMAARDATACKQLVDPQDRASCGSWLALEAALRPEGAGCKALPAPLAAACRHLTVAGHDCASETADGARDACEQLAGAAGAVEDVCGAAFEPTRCGWGLLVSGLRDGRQACEAVAPGPGRRSPRHVRTAALCRAVLTSTPDRCPDTLAAQAPGDQVYSFAESTVIGAVSGAQIVGSLHVDTPAICALRVELRGTDDAVAGVVTEVLSPNSWSPMPMWRDLTRGASADELRAETTVACAPRVVWSKPVEVPRAPRAAAQPERASGSP